MFISFMCFQGSCILPWAGIVCTTAIKNVSKWCFMFSLQYYLPQKDYKTSITNWGVRWKQNDECLPFSFLCILMTAVVF